jgi:hypothetical protein
MRALIFLEKTRDGVNTVRQFRTCRDWHSGFSTGNRAPHFRNPPAGFPITYATNEWHNTESKSGSPLVEVLSALGKSIVALEGSRSIWASPIQGWSERRRSGAHGSSRHSWVVRLLFAISGAPAATIDGLSLTPTNCDDGPGFSSADERQRPVGAADDRRPARNRATEHRRRD